MIRVDACEALPDVDSRNRVAPTTRHVLVILRSLSWTRFSWTLGIGAVGGLLFLASHSMHRIQSLLEHEASLADTILESAVAVGISIVVAFLLLLAVSVAEHGDREEGRGWIRYAMATLIAVGAATAIVHLLLPHVPVAGLVGWYNMETRTSIDSFVFTNWLLFGGLGVFVYVRSRRARRSQAAFECAELERVAASRELLMSRLAASQAQVEPAFLFDTLRQVETQYEHNSASGDRMIDDLIAYLRAALPQLRGEDSTLAREAELAEAYLRILQRRMGTRLAFAFDIPPALGTNHFPPMLLLPLVENSVRYGLEPLPKGGRLEIHATSQSGRMRVTVSDSGLRDAAGLRDDQGLDTLRERLAGLFGGEATLTLDAGRPCGVTATIELPSP